MSGSTILMLLFPGMWLYLVLGALFNWSIGQRGGDIVPHKKILVELPELILDGFMFTASKFTFSSRQMGSDTEPVLP